MACYCSIVIWGVVRIYSAASKHKNHYFTIFTNILIMMIEKKHTKIRVVFSNIGIIS